MNTQATDLRTWSREDLMRTVRNAGELWNSTGGDDPDDVLSEAARQRLDRAASAYLIADSAEDLAELRAEHYAACDHAIVCPCLGSFQAAVAGLLDIPVDQAEELAEELWRGDDEAGQPPATPVADALQAVDQAGTEYGVPSAELRALRMLAGAVRSHGIGTELAARRLPALECAWCGKPATLDGCTVCDSTGIRKVPGQLREQRTTAPPVPGVTAVNGHTVIAVLPGVRDLAWYVAADSGVMWSAGHLFVSGPDGQLTYEPSGLYGQKSRALQALAELAGIAHVAPF